MNPLRSFLICVGIVVLLFHYGQRAAGTEGGTEGQPAEEVVSSQPEQEVVEAQYAWVFPTILALFSNPLVPSGLLGGLSLTLTLRIVVLRRQRNRAKVALEGASLPVKVEVDERRNSIMLLGIGGTGKTTLIRSLFNDNTANPDIRTDKYVIYSKTERIPAPSPESSCSLYISDYVGQNLGMLIRAFLEEQARPYSPMRYGFVESLILMVDVVRPPSLQDQPQDANVNMVHTYDKARVEEHLEQWNTQSLDAVFGMMTATLGYVCLFINKVDLLKNRTVEIDRDIMNIFEPLRRALQARCAGAEFETLIGSALNGGGIPRLHSKLTQHSVTSTVMRIRSHGRVGG